MHLNAHALQIPIPTEWINSLTAEDLLRWGKSESVSNRPSLIQLIDYLIDNH